MKNIGWHYGGLPGCSVVSYTGWCALNITVQYASECFIKAKSRDLLYKATLFSASILSFGKNCEDAAIVK